MLSPRAAHAERVVAIAPLSTLGAEDTSAGDEEADRPRSRPRSPRCPAPRSSAPPQVADAIKKAKKPQLKRVRGRRRRASPSSASWSARRSSIAGEVGGLGESTVVYLAATDVATGKELRSTTLAVGAQATTAAARPAR